jgi:hypothetical protein
VKRVAPSRLAKLEARLHPPRDPIGRLVIGCVERWPAEAQVAWDAACMAGDLVRQEDLVERYEGARPRLGGPHISLILVPAPPDELNWTPIADEDA